jgi:hypothetical protein
MIPMAEGVCAQQAGEWAIGRDRCAAAMAALADSPGAFYELANARFFWLETLLYLGELDELSAAVPRFLEDAGRRGDAYSLGYLRGGSPTFRWIWAGEPARALAEVRGVAATLPREGFHVPHLMAMLAETQALLAADQRDAAWERVEHDWRALERSLLLRAQNVLIEMTSLRGRVAIATGRAALARTCAARIRRERMPWGDALAALLEAALAGPALAAARWRTAADLAAASSMRMHAQAAAARAGESPSIPAAAIAAVAPTLPEPG